MKVSLSYKHLTFSIHVNYFDVVTVRYIFLNKSTSFFAKPHSEIVLILSLNIFLNYSLATESEIVP